jgi:phosphoglycolate phosphatase
MIRGLVFDKDGTLFDFRRSWASWTSRLLADLSEGDPVRARALGARIGFDPWTGLFARDSVVIAGTPEDAAAALLPGLPGMDRRALISAMVDVAGDAVQVPVTDLPALLGALRARGLILGLATNDAEEGARAHLRAHGLRPSR